MAGGFLRRLRHATRGVSAVEFALIAPTIIMIYFALVEVDLTGPRAGRSRVHCTAWDSRRDEIVEMPERHRR